MKSGKKSKEESYDSDPMNSLSTLEHKFQPLVLKIHVEKAHSVPVGDIQSSDPYCVVFVGSKRVGKTAVRSWTVNPTWNQHFTVPLLHLKHPVTFEIWDHDSVGADDILGKVTLNLSDLPPNIKMAKKMNLEKASPTIKPRGTLQFDILLERKDTLINVEQDLDEGLVAISTDSRLPQATVELIQDMLTDLSTPSALQRSFFQSEIVRSELLHWSYYRDVLLDLNHMFSTKINPNMDSLAVSQENNILSHLNMAIKRPMWPKTGPRPTHSIRICLDTNVCSASCFPPSGFSVVLETALGDIYTFIAVNRFIYWNFIKSLKRLFFLTSRPTEVGSISMLRRLHYVSEEDCEKGWQETVNFSGNLQVIVLNKTQTCLCTINPILKRLIMLNVETNIEVFNIPLESVEYMHLGAEYEEYKPYDFKLNIISGKFSRNIEDLCNRVESSEVPVAESSDAGGKWYPGKALAKVVKGTGSIVKNSVVEASSSVNAVANSVIAVAIRPKAFQTKIVVNFPSSCEYETRWLEGRGPYWDETCQHRVSIADILANEPKEIEKKDTAVGIIVHLLGESADKAKTVMGSRFIRYSELVPPHAIGEVDETTFTSRGGNVSQEVFKSFPLDTDISLNVHIIRGECLLPPERSLMSMETILTSTTDHLLDGMNVVTNAVMLTNGERISEANAEKSAHGLLTNRKPYVIASFAGSDRSLQENYAACKTKSIESTCDPVWKETLKLHANDGMYSAKNVLLQVTDRWRRGSVEGKMGEIIIPVSTFFTEATLTGGKVIKRLPILPSFGMSQASNKFTEGCLGHLLVEISLSMEKKTTPQSPHDKKYFPPSIDVRAQVHSASEFGTAFPCEAVTKSAMTQKIPSQVEQFHIAPGHEGVIFLSDEHKDLSLDDVNEKSNNALLHQFQRHYSREGKDFIEYHVFENQRRLLLEWGCHHLMKFERPAYTEESGTIECPFTNHDIKFSPPSGYEWLENSRDQWIIDKEYTNTDEDGWVYGSDFGYVMQNLRSGASVTTSHLRPVRRRRWKRIAVRSLINTSDSSKRDEKATAAARFDESKNSKSQATSKQNLKAATEIFEVFYNQRRSVLTLSFGPNNLFPTDRHAFTDGTGQRSFPKCKDVEDIRPPTGYEWVEGSKWKTDQEYTNTDEFGWSYAVDFHYLESNVRKGKSTTSSTLQSVRRKKYFREMVAVDVGDISKLLKRSETVRQNDGVVDVNLLKAAAPTTRLESFHRNSNQILGLCRERDTLTSPILVPWDRVRRVDVVSPSVLSIGLMVHRYFGEDSLGNESYREVEVEIFIVECPSEQLCALIGDRLQFFKLRSHLKTLINAGTMTGESSDTDYGDMSALVMDEKENSFTARELSLGSRTIESLYDATIQIDMERQELIKNKQTTVDRDILDWIDVEVMHLSRLHGRIKLYISLLLTASLVGPSYEEADVKRVISSDKDEANKLFEFVSDDQVARQTVSFLLDMAELRVRDYALCGWSHQGVLLENSLRMIINGYYINIVEALGYFFDSKDALESLKGNESKLTLIEFIIENDNHFNLLVENSLLPYNLKISPPPLLSLSLNIKSLLHWYSELLSDEMRGYVHRTFEVTLSSMPQSSQSEYFLPWEITRDDGILISSIPLDTRNILKGYLTLTKSRFNKQFVSIDVKAGLNIIEQRIQVLYVDCLVKLVGQYYDFLSKHDWIEPLPLSDGRCFDEETTFQAVGDHLDWLSSVANDCIRMESLLLDETSELNDQNNILTPQAMQDMEGLKSTCEQDLTKTSNLALEFLSCIIFKSFEGIVPTVRIYDSWYSTEDMVQKFLEEIRWYLTSRFEFLEKPCRVALLEICLKKVVAWYLFFLKECAEDSKIKFKHEHYDRIQADVDLIVSSFSEQNKLLLSEEQEVDQNRISHELQRFQRIFVLLTEPIGSVEYTVAICNILDDVKLYPEEGKAMSSCLKAILKITQRNSDYVPNVENEYGVHPEQYIKTMSTEMAAAAATIDVRHNRKLFSLGAYILVFEAQVKPYDYFIHSATRVMKASTESSATSSQNQKSATPATGRRSSVAQIKNFFHL